MPSWSTIPPKSGKGCMEPAPAQNSADCAPLILSFLEAEMLAQVSRHPGVNLHIALFDGGYVACEDVHGDIALRFACSRARIPMEIKFEPPRDLTFVAVLLRLPSCRIAHSHAIKSDCLLDALASIEPSCEVQGLSDQVQGSPGSGMSAQGPKQHCQFYCL